MLRFLPMKPALKLLKWYQEHGRDLPWRKTRNPYHILVSEIMLQQTQVDRVKTFYRDWLKVFPTWKRLAEASNEQVVRQWSGLGYNRRALALRDIAMQVNEHGIPQTEEDWQKLKGIGPYTASAISAFAQLKRTMPIDTNIRRVLGRLLFGIPYPQPDIDSQIQSSMETFLPKSGVFYDVPQALFDLATTTCTKIPTCSECPLKTICLASQAFLSGTVSVPKQMVKKVQEQKHRSKSHPDRIYRGRILAIAKTEPGTSFEDVGPLIDKTFDRKLDQAWVESMIKRLENEGLLKTNARTILL